MRAISTSIRPTSAEACAHSGLPSAAAFRRRRASACRARSESRVGAGSESAADEVLVVLVCWAIGRNVARPGEVRQRDLCPTQAGSVMMATVQLPFLNPMFDDRQAIFGIPTTVLLFGIAAALLVAAFVITVRMTRGDPEPRPFRATTGADATDLITRGVVVGLAGAAGLAALVLLLRL